MANHRSAPARCPRRVCRLAGVLVLAACGVLGPAEPAAADGYPPVDLAAVDRLIGDELGAASIPGAAIAITRGDQLLHVRGYGHDADDVPITEDTRFRTAACCRGGTGHRPFIPARADVLTGVVLLGFAVGWALLAVLSVRVSDRPQR